MAAAAALAAMMAMLVASPARAQDYQRGITPYMPITVPLAVRSPYLGAYLSGGRDKNLATMSPNFWTGSPLVRRLVLATYRRMLEADWIWRRAGRG